MKKAVPIAALIVIAAFQILVYWNTYLLHRANDPAAGPARKIEALALAVRIYPWNDQAWFELGKARFETGAESLGEARVRDAAFAGSVQSFLKALKLNPGSAATHFHLAQSLQYMSYLSLPTPVPYFDEYKRAASLTGHNSQVYHEVGKVLLSRWESLRPEEKEFTLDILRKMLAGRDQERLRDLLEVWHLHGQDYAVIDHILPEDASLLRVYARFLGEKSLSLEVRQRSLARAEFLDFVEAGKDFDQGARSFENFQAEEAAAHITACLRLLGSISLYQTLGSDKPIDPAEFAELRRAAYLLLAKSQVEKSRSLSNPDHYLETYLELEDQPLAVGELEKFLEDRGLLRRSEAAESRPKDLSTLAFELGLDFKQNRYRDIARAGELLEKSAVVIPEAGRTHYAKILRLVGDSYLKLDYVYEAEKFYLKALALRPDDLEGLIKLERCYDRLNDDWKMAEVRRRIDALLSPGAIELGRRTLQKEDPLRVDLVCDGQPLTLNVTIESLRPGGRPLLAAFFNGRVVAEKYVDGGTLSFAVTPVAGSNSLVLKSFNEPVILVKIDRRAASEAWESCP
jgi:tetratricopeptide (TPR) repeat protein